MRGRHCSHRYAHMGEWEALCASLLSLTHGRKETSLRNMPPSPPKEWRPLCATYLPTIPQGGVYTRGVPLRVVYTRGVPLRVVYLPPYIPQGGVPASLHTSGGGIYLRVYLREWYIPQGVPQGGICLPFSLFVGGYRPPFLPFLPFHCWSVLYCTSMVHI